MLELKKISKTYHTGTERVSALNKVSISFRDSEFVAVLGASGSGKTTLLNIIGGLDRYDSGDLIINGRTTKKYNDKDWDGYRNHSVGFVFQNYNLIPHQTVLANVELALTLSGVSKAERRRRAVEVLEKVGLGDQLNKKPNQMSGGQMQRVAIARALVNDPDILLADEPTGALDSKTSVQIMELIQQIAKDRLVIMVTHNPKLAKAYATRLVRIKDGRIRKDTDPYEPQPVRRPKAESNGQKRPEASMSFGTALSLSFNNLLTKKGRTLLTSFAGSIGIIGIALILALSNGMQVFISGIEKGTLASYPITIEGESIDFSSILENIGSSGSVNKPTHELDKVYKKPTLQNSVSSMALKTQKNDLARFKTFLQMNEQINEYCMDIKYRYSVDLNIYKADTTGGVHKVRPSEILDSVGAQSDIWTELVGNEEILDSQYDVLAGKWPQQYNELVLFLDKNNEISDVSFYALGLSDLSELEEIVNSSNEDETSEQNDEAQAQLEGFDYNEFLNLKFKVVPKTDYYEKSGKKWVDKSDDNAYMKKVLEKALEIKIVGIVRPKASTQSPVAGGSVGYMSELTDQILAATNASAIVKEQKKNTGVDVFTGLRFKTEKGKKAATETSAAAVSLPEPVFAVSKNPLPAVTQVEEEFTVMTEDEIYTFIDERLEGEDKEMMTEMVRLMLKNIRSDSEKKELMGYLNTLLEGTEADPEQVYSYLHLMNRDMKLQLLSAIMMSVESGEKIEIPTQGELEGSAQGGSQSTTPSPKPAENEEQFSDSSLEENLFLLGASDPKTPSAIEIYPKDFESKEQIIAIIDDYNTHQQDEGTEEYMISYTDYVSVIMSSVTRIIDLVTYALVAFVAISLIVSSIMIGIITYISVLERTKEIGILRSIGASKKDISRVFNSETIIIGFVSGVMGILASLLLLVPINAIINAVSNIPNLAVMPFYGGLTLIAISVVLTVIAGLVPSRIAAKKDPVVALRSGD